MTVNRSNARDPRFWKKWLNSGAIGTMPKLHIHTFYAVTVSNTSTSLYEVRDRMDKKVGYTVAEKIAIRGKSENQVGHKIGSHLIAICKWLIPYIPEGGGITSYKRDIASVNTRWWSQSTSPISALFLNRKAAQKCFKASNHVPCDPRWLEETIAVLTAIGNDNPHFTVCQWPGLNLMEAIAAA